MAFIGKAPHIAILGEIGSGNLGDDLGYFLLKKEIEKHFEYSHINWLTPSRFSVLDYMGYDCVILGCGTLLDKAQGGYMKKIYEMQERGIRTAILGSGISDTAHIPTTQDGKLMFNKVCERALHKFIRGDKPDLMWLLGNRGTDNKDNVIGLNFGFAGYTTRPILDIRDKVLQLENYFKSIGQPTIRVSAWGNDNAWFENPQITVDGSEQSMNELSRLKGIVAFRGHLGVVSACANVNVCAIGYSSKIKQMYDQVPIEYALLDVNSDSWVQDVTQHFEKKTNYRKQVEVAQAILQSEIKEFCEKLKGDL